MQHVRQRTSGIAIIVEGSETDLTLELLSEMELSWGDELKLEIVQQQDALYIIDVCVRNTGPLMRCKLDVQGEPHRLQRRCSQRIPTRLQAQYILLEKETAYRQGLIMDISKNGALLYVEEPLDLFEKLMLFIEIFTGKGDALTTGLSGKIIREHAGKKSCVYSYGIEFDKSLTLFAV